MANTADHPDHLCAEQIECSAIGRYCSIGQDSIISGSYIHDDVVVSRACPNRSPAPQSRFSSLLLIRVVVKAVLLHTSTSSPLPELLPQMAPNLLSLMS